MASLPSETPALVPEDPTLQAEIERLGERLASRASIVLFARGFVLACVSVVGIGVASRLLAESSRLPHFFWPVALVGLGCLVAALVSLRAGRRLLASERTEFERYLALRARAGLDG